VLANCAAHGEDIPVGGLPAHRGPCALKFLDQLVKARRALRQGNRCQFGTAAVPDHVAHPDNHEALGLYLVINQLLQNPVVRGELDGGEVGLDQRVVHLVLIGGVVTDRLDGLGDRQAEHALLTGIEIQGLAVVGLGLADSLDDGVREYLLPAFETRVLVEGFGVWRGLGLAGDRGAVGGNGHGGEKQAHRKG
jgi:hypothetical protein